MLTQSARRDLENAELQYSRLMKRSEDLQYQLDAISAIGEDIPGDYQRVQQEFDEVCKQISAINALCNQLDDAIHPF